jgi:hypothetical protein
MTFRKQIYFPPSRLVIKMSELRTASLDAPIFVAEERAYRADGTIVLGALRDALEYHSSLPSQIRE